MSGLEDLETLHSLKEKGVISAEEFEKKKAEILNASAQNQGNTSQLAYVLLAFFLGVFGVHNFYAGRWKRGLCQLLLTFTLVGALFTNLWAIINIFTIHTDGKGNEMQPCKVAKYIFGIIGLLWYLIWAFVMAAGIIVGYTTAMDNYNLSESLVEESKNQVLSQLAKPTENKPQGNSLAIKAENRYKANVIENYASQVYVVALASNGGEGIQENQTCKDLLPLPDEFANQEIYCIVSPDGRVAFSGLDEGIKEDLTRKANIKETEKGNIIITFGQEG